MEIVLNNPFRVLGLTPTASIRDITKRISDLETFAEIKKEKKLYPYDFLELGVLDRSLEAIKDAARKIESVEGRLFHSFFWFRSGDSVDELALESLEKGNSVEAASLWDKKLGKKGVKKYTWRLNRSILHLTKAFGDNTLDVMEIEEALEHLGFVISDHLDDLIEDVLAGNKSSLNQENIWRWVADEMVTIIQSYSGDLFGKNSVKIIKFFWSFPLGARDYVSSKLINPLIDEVKDVIEISEGLRENEDLEALKSKNHLDKVEFIIKDLGEVLGESDIRFQAIANAYAMEVEQCAVEAIKKFKDFKLSLLLIQWADNLPSFSRIKTRIEENLEKIERINSRLPTSSGNIFSKIPIWVWIIGFVWLISMCGGN